MADFGKVGQEVYEILLSFDYTVMLYDTDGTRVAEPTDARRFVAPKDNIMKLPPPVSVKSI